MVLKITFLMLLTTASLGSCKPISVSFGTRQGPIVPPTPSSTTVNPLAPKNPAPVYENQEDDVPPPQYRAPTPNQYRNQLIAHGLGHKLTQVDLKYLQRPTTPATVVHHQHHHQQTVGNNAETLNELELRRQKAQVAQQQGLQYVGAQVFDVQPYEVDRAIASGGTTRNEKKLTNAQLIVQQYLSPKRRQELDQEDSKQRAKKDNSKNLQQQVQQPSPRPIYLSDNNRVNEQQNARSHLNNNGGNNNNVGIVLPNGFVNYYYVPPMYHYANNRPQPNVFYTRDFYQRPQLAFQ